MNTEYTHIDITDPVPLFQVQTASSITMSARANRVRMGDAAWIMLVVTCVPARTGGGVSNP